LQIIDFVSLFGYWSLPESLWGTVPLRIASAARVSQYRFGETAWNKAIWTINEKGHLVIGLPDSY
jgi:hypothetical protein